MIFQDPMTSLNPVYTVGYQIAEAVLAHRDVSKAEARERAVELLRTVRIPNPEQRVDSYPHELSGGMRQRVVIAIAMANDPDVIIADEPTTALDVTVQAQVLEALQAAQKATGAAMVLITHDLGVIAGQADRVLVMYAGKPVEIGGVEDIFYTPRMPYTLGLLGSLPRLDQQTERLTPIPGAPPSAQNMPPGCPFSPRCPLSTALCDETEPDLTDVGDRAPRRLPPLVADGGGAGRRRVRGRRGRHRGAGAPGRPDRGRPRRGGPLVTTVDAPALLSVQQPGQELPDPLRRPDPAPGRRRPGRQRRVVRRSPRGRRSAWSASPAAASPHWPASR